ncbi:sensor histidine kinase [Terriglobus sp. ADX1]|uniref:sensor histidine kinase n=1 Tax=Terriglobus sp. ADX1 TaxID=2794063 RepID=UPI002FE6C2DA
MSSGTVSLPHRGRTAAWRISLWSGVAFAIGTAIAFWFLQGFLVNDIQNRSDSWLTGELGVLSDVAERTPGDRLHEVVVGEVAELASREVPRDENTPDAMTRAVFFIATTPQGELLLDTGAGNGAENLKAIQETHLDLTRPRDVAIPGFAVPFRVASSRLPAGGHIYLALSTSYERRVLHRLQIEFAFLWCAIIVLGTAIVFVSTRRMLHRVQVISETASLIGRSNLRSRVPTESTGDEIAQLSVTFNGMLDRIESAVQQLHTMSDSLAHDLRSPMTSMRGKLELALMSESGSVREEAMISSIEELDRLSTLFNTSLDVSEANADALRLRKEPIDLEILVSSMVELYEPSFAQAGLSLQLRSNGPAMIDGDSALIQRTLTNLLDNALKHTRSGTSVIVTVLHEGERSMLRVEDNGAGFPDELIPRLFERYVKGDASSGHGLGLAFVSAVVRSHDGQVRAGNRDDGGASITIEFPVPSTALVR